MRGMRVPITLDLHLSNFTYPGVDGDGLFEKLVEIATTAEDAGFSSFSVMDHLHQIPPVGPPTNFMLEGNTILGGLAARTSKATLGLLVGGVTYRNPALMAKATTTLDVISGGRAWLGLGAAWFEEEHVAYGYEFPPLGIRFEHLEDALQIARRMFTEEEASYEGKHHRISNALNNPRPLRGDIPILVGGSGERKTLRLVAQYADGCNLFGAPDQLRHLLGVLERHCEDVGRDSEEITKTTMRTIIVDPSPEQAQAKRERFLERTLLPLERVEPTLLSGDPDTIAERVQEILDVGIQGLTISVPEMYDPEILRLVGETISPLVGAPAV